jgi:hypothetical protein
MSSIWDATIKVAKTELAAKRRRIEQSLNSLQHQDSDFANDHRRLLRLYEKMAQAMEEA